MRERERKREKDRERPGLVYGRVSETPATSRVTVEHISEEGLVENRAVF